MKRWIAKNILDPIYNFIYSNALEIADKNFKLYLRVRYAISGVKYELENRALNHLENKGLSKNDFSPQSENWELALYYYMLYILIRFPFRFISTFFFFKKRILIPYFKSKNIFASEIRNRFN